MAYVKNVPAWVEGAAPGISAARLTHLETQYDEADTDLDAHKINIAAGDGRHRWTLNKLLKGAGAAAPTEIDVPSEPTKEFFIPVSNGTDRTEDTYYTCFLINAAADDAYLIFHVPHDFTSLTEAVVVNIPVATATHRLNFYTYYGANGETRATHSESILDQDVAETGAFLSERDISAMFSSLAANDHVGIKVVGDATNISNNRILGVRIKYS